MDDSLNKLTLNFPSASGVYLMKDSRGQIIYVGKAKDLKKRVRQYILKNDSRTQISFLMSRVKTIDYIITDSEQDALLLENSLIKKHKPKYNLFLKDDKTYRGLKLTIKDNFPRLFETRRIKKDGSEYFGPFTSGESIREVKEFIYRFFLLRTCNDHEFRNRTRPCLEYQIKRCSAPCVNYVSKEDYKKQIEQVRLFLHGKNKNLQKLVKDRMLKASTNENFEEAARLRDLLQNMGAILEKQHVTQLSFEFVDLIAFDHFDDKIAIAVLMVRDSQLIDSKYFVLSSLEDSENAISNFITQYYSDRAFIPKEILVPFDLANKEVLQNILQERAQRKISIRSPKKGEKKDLLELAFTNLRSHFDQEQLKQEQQQKTLLSLQKKLHLSQIPYRIECYDISNISGKDAVGSMVTFTNGKPNKDLYRKFKIKSLDTPNDYAMLFEVLQRRLQKNSDDWQHPDLILIDGGKGQLKQAQKILNELNLTIPIASIAKGQGQGARAKGVYDEKKQDEIYIPNRKNPIALKSTSAELMLLQNLRDESHRFAITFHRKLREKHMTSSWLDTIKGLGPMKKKALLKHFGSAEKVANASLQDLESTSVLSKSLAKQIFLAKKS